MSSSAVPCVPCRMERYGVDRCAPPTKCCQLSHSRIPVQCRGPSPDLAWPCLAVLWLAKLPCRAFPALALWMGCDAEYHYSRVARADEQGDKLKPGGQAALSKQT